MFTYVSSIWIIYEFFYLIVHGDAGCADWFLDFFNKIFMCKFAH